MNQKENDKGLLLTIWKIFLWLLVMFLLNYNLKSNLMLHDKMVKWVIMCTKFKPN